MSSRNSYLSADERRTAAAIYRALSAAEQLAKTGTRQPDALKNKIQAVVREEKGIEIDYLEIADPESLAPLVSAQDDIVLLIAVRIGRTRLIDNLLLQ
jgi:pantoate--beta-alanine ligase